MAKKEGLLIVFEGIDGAGTSTQLPLLTAHIKKKDKYQDVMETHEPWDNDEIKRRLAEDKDAYVGGLQLAQLFVQDRTEHTKRLIRPNLQAGVIVETDRYSMSTCSYQMAQGVPIERLIEMHNDRGILIPDLTLVIHADREVAKRRIKKRGDPLEKFERDPDFVDRLVNAYQSLAHLAQVSQGIFGKVVLINGNQSITQVANNVRSAFDPLYQSWKSGEYIPQISKRTN